MTNLVQHALIIGGCAAALLVSAVGALLVYGAPIGGSLMLIGARIAAMGGETIVTSAPVCDKAVIYAEVADVVAEAVARPVTVVRNSGSGGR